MRAKPAPIIARTSLLIAAMPAPAAPPVAAPTVAADDQEIVVTTCPRILPHCGGRCRVSSAGSRKRRRRISFRAVPHDRGGLGRRTPDDAVLHRAADRDADQDQPVGNVVVTDVGKAEGYPLDAIASDAAMASFAQA